jgi:transglutaminase-like putative cysteine protease
MNIPARINVGLVYQDGKFAYHAWPQAWVNGRWYLFEPTFGQFPVDATHIKLLSGNLDKQVQLLRLSDVSINVVEASERCP